MFMITSTTIMQKMSYRNTDVFFLPSPQSWTVEIFSMYLNVLKWSISSSKYEIVLLRGFKIRPKVLQLSFLFSNLVWSLKLFSLSMIVCLVSCTDKASRFLLHRFYAFSHLLLCFQLELQMQGETVGERSKLRFLSDWIFLALRWYLFTLYRCIWRILCLKL